MRKTTDIRFPNNNNSLNTLNAFLILCILFIFQVHSLTSKLPLTYGYRFTDDYGTMQAREEKTDPNGSKTGSYSFVDATGLYRKVEYVADRHGFRATVSTNEPGTISIDPAHVRMLTDNKHIRLGDFNHATGISPQLEYSSHIFSRYNLTNDFEDHKNLAVQSLGINSESPIPHTPIFESEREQPNVYSVNSYKGSPMVFAHEISSIIHQLHETEPVIYGNAQNSNANNHLDGANVNPDFIFNDKVSGVGYKKKVPTRYPRRQNSRIRTKKTHTLRIHIPKGYESYPDLPLYRDK